jgi:Sec20
MAAVVLNEKASVEAFRQERNTLFQQNYRFRRKQTPANSTTASEAAAIQQSLSRTQKLLKSELARVAAVQSAINDDEQLLRKTIDTHKTLDVSGAKRALTELERAEQYERRVLFASVVFFWGVVLYVLWCRIFIRIPLVDQALLLVIQMTKYFVRFIDMLQSKIIELAN